MSVWFARTVPYRFLSLRYLGQDNIHVHSLAIRSVIIPTIELPFASIDAGITTSVTLKEARFLRRKADENERCVHLLKYNFRYFRHELNRNVQSRRGSSPLVREIQDRLVLSVQDETRSFALRGNRNDYSRSSADCYDIGKTCQSQRSAHGRTTVLCSVSQA